MTNEEEGKARPGHWTVRVAQKADKQLRKLDKPTRALIYSWIERNIDGCDDPRAHGKALVGDLKGAWRYRIGDYRVLCEIRDHDLVVLAIEVAHRSEVYRKKR